MDFLQQFNVSEGSPELSLVLQMRLYECRIGEKNFFTQPTALLSRLIDATQCAVDHHHVKDIILTYFQLSEELSSTMEEFVFTNTVLLLIYFDTEVS